MSKRKQPGWIGDAELLAYDEGEAQPDIAAAIENSDDLQARLAELLAREARLAGGLHRFDCLPSLTLAEYHMQALDRGPRQQAEAHLAICPLCTQELKQMADFLGEPLPAADRLAGIKVLVAKLISPLLSGYGQSPSLVLAGARGGDGNTFLFEAEDMQVSLTLEDNSRYPERVDVTGLLLGRDPQDMFAVAAAEGQEERREPIDEGGNFAFEDLSRDQLSLTLQGPDLEIQIPL